MWLVSMTEWTLDTVDVLANLSGLCLVSSMVSVLFRGGGVQGKPNFLEEQASLPLPIPRQKS